MDVTQVSTMGEMLFHAEKLYSGTFIIREVNQRHFTVRIAKAGKEMIIGDSFTGAVKHLGLRNEYDIFERVLTQHKDKFGIVRKYEGFYIRRYIPVVQLHKLVRRIHA